MKQDKQEFYKKMEQELRKVFGSAYIVTFCSYKKLGWGEQEAFHIRKQEDAVAPIIPMEVPYQRFLEGVSVVELAEDVMEIYTQSVKEQKKNIGNVVSFLHDRENVEQSVFLHYVNTKQNIEMLTDLPHREMLNLSLVYSILLKTEKDTNAFITVNESIRNSYGWSEETLFEMANKNMGFLFPIKISSLAEVLSELTPYLETNSEHGLDTIEEEIPFTIVQNQNHFHGFSAIFYPGVLPKLAQIRGGNLIVIPSSVHEALVLVDQPELDAQVINKMITEINQTQVEPEEQLSDRAYYYDKDRKSLFFLDDYKKGDLEVCVRF